MSGISLSNCHLPYWERLAFEKLRYTKVAECCLAVIVKVAGVPPGDVWLQLPVLYNHKLVRRVRRDDRNLFDHFQPSGWRAKEMIMDRGIGASTSR